jgi:gamma-glutamyl-gamma-aminobutyrate hydrolase PuuD
MISDIELVGVRCRGCLRLVAKSHGHPMHKLFCSDLCAADYPVVENTERDDVIEAVARSRGWTATSVALHFELTRQRAQQILTERQVIIPRS